MKLSFSKSEELEVSVTHKTGGEDKAFSYIEMIRSLIEHKKLGEPELNGDFSESEKASISSMIAHINKEVSDFYNEEAQEE